MAALSRCSPRRHRTKSSGGPLFIHFLVHAKPLARTLQVMSRMKHQTTAETVEDEWPNLSWRCAMTAGLQIHKTRHERSSGPPRATRGTGPAARAASSAVLAEWELAPNAMPPLAAHVVTSRPGYTHHGIHVGNGRVVHYSGLSRGWRGGPVEEVSLAEFARGRAIRIRPHAGALFERDTVVARARSRLGEDRYRAMSNNCEHLCEWCIYGESRSHQVEMLRLRLRRAAHRMRRMIGAPLRLRALLRLSAQRQSVACDAS